MVFSLVFLDPSLPKLASGSPGPPNNFMVKKPTRLGELQLPQSNPFPINRCSRGGFKGEKVQKVRELREERKKTKKEEKMRPKRYRIAIMIIPYIVPCTMFFVRPSVSFVFKI